jgi:serine/threonine-protein kinase
LVIQEIQDSGVAVPLKPKKPYRLSPEPLGIGGQGRVMRAEHRETGEVFALKERNGDPQSAPRLRREIEVQRAIDHPHVMSIVDVAQDQSWYVMPLAVGNLKDLASSLDERELRLAFDHAAQGLGAAHELGYVHRDVTPMNILAFHDDDHGYRWVVADWGLVRQPHGKTTTVRTAGGVPLGVEGFAAPEMWIDSHNADARADIYGLGRVIAWALTGTWPSPNIPLLPPSGPWRLLVQRATAHNPADRPQSMAELRELIAGFTDDGAEPSAAEKAHALLDSIKKHPRDAAAIIALVTIVTENPSDSDLCFDYLGQLDGGQIGIMLKTDADLARAALGVMREHLLRGQWGSRSFDEANTYLGWLHNLAQVAQVYKKYELLEDAADALFAAEANWSRFGQRRDTRGWLENLSGDEAKAVANALMLNPKAVKWYLDEGWSPSPRSPDIRRVLK